MKQVIDGKLYDTETATQLGNFYNHKTYEAKDKKGDKTMEETQKLTDEQIDAIMWLIEHKGKFSGEALYLTESADNRAASRENGKKGDAQRKG